MPDLVVPPVLLLALLAGYFVLVIFVTTRSTMSPFLQDLAERAIKTFVQMFVAAVPAGAFFQWDIGAVKGAAIAAAGAVLSLVSSLLSKQFGNKTTASLTV